jgi:hypothetical protein
MNSAKKHRNPYRINSLHPTLPICKHVRVRAENGEEMRIFRSGAEDARKKNGR